MKLCKVNALLKSLLLIKLIYIKRKKYKKNKIKRKKEEKGKIKEKLTVL